MKPAVFHHLDGYQFYPGDSNEKYLILPFQGPNTLDGKNTPTNFYNECHDKIAFLVLSVLSEENEPNKIRLIQFPFTFSFLIFPVTSLPSGKFKPKDKGFDYIGPIKCAPGKRNTFIFLAVLGMKNQKPSQKKIYLFIANPPNINPDEFKLQYTKPLSDIEGKSDYLKRFIEIKDINKFNKILNCIPPTKTFTYKGNTEIKKIMFLSDGRHFLVSSEHEVFMYHVEDEEQVQLKIKFPQSLSILSCDYRNDTLLTLVKNGEKENPSQEIMFFNLQDRPCFLTDLNSGGDLPSFSIYVKTPIFLRYQYPRISLTITQKTSKNENNPNNDNIENNKFSKYPYIHNTKKMDSDFYIYGCKFLPGDNNFISIIIYEAATKKIYVYFFKLNHPPLENEITSFDIYQMNSIEIIESSEMFDDALKSVVYSIDPEKDSFDIVGTDDEFEFTFMLFPQILVRFHYISNDISDKRVSSVQIINIKGYKESMRAIMVPDQQSDPDSTYKYLPVSFQTKSEQVKYFQKEAKKVTFEWLKLLGQKASSNPSIFQIETTPYSGFKNFATFDTTPENRDK